MRALAIVLLGACTGTPKPAATSAATPGGDALAARGVAPSGSPTVVYVVRHTEAAAPSGDPSLSEAGVARAQRLASVMADKQLAAIDTTQLKRAFETGKVVADAAGLVVDVQPIDTADVPAYAPAIAAHIRQAHAGTATLVVGHSHTVPAIVEAFSGRAVPAIAPTEYDRLYTITIAADGTAHVESGTY